MVKFHAMKIANIVIGGMSHRQKVRDEMTREEIENIPKNVNILLGLSVTPHTRQKLDEKLSKVCELAIKALEQEPCEDAISRQAAIDAFKPRGISEEVWKESHEYQVLKGLPSVTPKEKTGHWIDNHNGTISCNHCHTWFNKDNRYSYMYYCPSCKAKMAEGSNEK